jgi:hypothetical protein
MNLALGRLLQLQLAQCYLQRAAVLVSDDCMLAIYNHFCYELSSSESIDIFMILQFLCDLQGFKNEMR